MYLESFFSYCRILPVSTSVFRVSYDYRVEAEIRIKSLGGGRRVGRYPFEKCRGLTTLGKASCEFRVIQREGYY